MSEGSEDIDLGFDLFTEKFKTYEKQVLSQEQEIIDDLFE